MQAATRSGLDAAAAELPRERFPADEDALGLQYEPPERGATVADNEHRREDLREHFKEAVFARCTVPWRRTHRIASPPCPLQRGRRSATSSRPSRACARLACSTSRPSAGPLSRTTSTGAGTCASTSRRQWRLPLYLNLSAHVLARMTSSQSCSTYPIEGRWVGWVEIGSTCARERGKAPRRPPRRRGHRRSPREGQNQRYQGQHNLVRCRRRPLVECALVVYLRDPSFEVHGSLPHRYAKVPPRAIGRGCRCAPETGSSREPQQRLLAAVASQNVSPSPRRHAVWLCVGFGARPSGLQDTISQNGPSQN